MYAMMRSHYKGNSSHLLISHHVTSCSCIIILFSHLHMSIFLELLSASEKWLETIICYISVTTIQYFAPNMIELFGWPYFLDFCLRSERPFFADFAKSFISGHSESTKQEILQYFKNISRIEHI